MNIVDIPPIAFSKWKRWSDRERPSQDFDVPLGFGVLGIYILGTCEVDAAIQAPESRYLDSSVIYIGMSSHVDQRLERTHKAVERYRLQTGDRKHSNLMFSVWYSGFTKGQFDVKGPILATAKIALYERALLFNYAEKFGCLPSLNRQ